LNGESYRLNVKRTLMSDAENSASFSLDATDSNGSDFSAGTPSAIILSAGAGRTAAAPFRANRCCSLWSDRAGAPSGPFWAAQLADFQAHGGMIQIGPTCVSNSLSLLTLGAARPEDFQGEASGVNTQDPVTWSHALKRFGKKLAYTSSDTRRLRWYVPELLRLDDIFTVSYYTGDFTSDPSDDGWVCGSHIVVVAGGMLYDSCRDDSPTALGSPFFDELYGCKFLKRIFRVVPADYPSEL
jgi:hypothetical protein